MDKITELHSEGVPKKRIARILGLSKNTVKKYLDRPLQLNRDAEAGRASPNSLSDTGTREAALNALLPQINRELGRNGVTRQLLWEEYKTKYPQGFSYGRFCDRIRQYRNVQNATIKLHHKAGHQLTVDFAGKKVHWLDKHTGELVACEVLVCVLPYSKYTFACAVPSQKQDDFVWAINQALLFIGGLPQVILSDNLRSFVKKSDRYEPIFSEFCAQFAMYYGLELQAARVGKPKDKASVERHVQVVYNRVYGPLRDRTFYSIEEINKAFMDQLQVHNSKPLQGKEYSRLEIFEAEEKLLLASLPSELFERKKSTSAKVQRNYHVILGEDKHQYSVPYRYIGKQTSIVYTTTQVEVFCGMDRIAMHKRDRRHHAYSTFATHMPEKHIKYLAQRGWDEKDFQKMADNIGPATRWVMDEILRSKQHVEQTYNACLGVMRLQNKYSKDRLEQACMRARSTHRASYGIIKNILQNGTDKLLPQANQLRFTIPKHKNIRGPSNYE